MKKLRNCYDELQIALGEGIEPFESVELVEKYRQFWKPKNVKVLLLAESHVFTSNKIRTIKIPSIKGLEGYPTDYARFIYCLGLGEKELTKSVIHPSRDGSPQFWKVLYACDNEIEGNESFKAILSNTKFEQRMRNKIELLIRLRDKGIWLVDASIIALYNKGKKPTLKQMNTILEVSWNGYVKDVIKECNPQHTIIIGKGVAKKIEHNVKSLVGNDNVTVLPQPNAHLTANEHLEAFKTYLPICLKNQI